MSAPYSPHMGGGSLSGEAERNILVGNGTGGESPPRKNCRIDLIDGRLKGYR